MSEKKEQWGSRLGLILAMAGNAVGLGNFLRFPVQAVQNGGGTFIIPYLVCFFLLGIPLLWVEWAMGRFGGRSGHHSPPFILQKHGRNPLWKYVGVLGIFTNIGIVAYYCYIESWTLSYVIHSLSGTFSGMSQTQVAQFFLDYVDITNSTTFIPYEPIVMYVVVLALNTYFLSKGLQGGIEAVAKLAMPLLLIFGILLAVTGLSLGDSGAPAGCLDCNATFGINFLWEPDFESIFNIKIWLAAAGQIFFTISVGMGTVHCYASYVKSKDDIALSAMTAGWMNLFVEIVLGASVVIPIAVGYLGLDWVRENAGFAMAFQTMPYLFQQWDAFIGTSTSVMWFGLLFIAGITSSLAMGTPWMGFMSDNFNWGRKASAWSFGVLILFVGLPTVVFFNNGVFDEYDYWAGTVSLVVFALFESILFSWIFGLTKGWNEINRSAELKVPGFYKYIIKYLTPVMLIILFTLSVFEPTDWEKAFKGQWELSPNSILGKLQNKGVVANKKYIANYFETETDGFVSNIYKNDEGEQFVEVSDKFSYFINDVGRVKLLEPHLRNDEKAFLDYFDSVTVVATYKFKPTHKIIVATKQKISIGDQIATGKFVNNVFHTDMTKILLASLFIFIVALVVLAQQKRRVEIRQTRKKIH